MKILIVSQHFYPDEFRINEVAETLVKNGHEVTVYTSLPDYKTGKVPKNCRGLKNRKFNYNGVKVVRCFSVSRRTGVIFRALNYISFLATSTVRAYLTKQRFDVVMCYQTSPVLMANAARAVAKKQKIPFLLYCLDLWPECLKAWSVTENTTLYRLVHKYSKHMYNDADIVAVSSKPFIKYHKDVNGVPEEKMIHIPQHSEDMDLPKKVRVSEDEPIIFAFGGNIGSVQNVECIVRATAELKDLKSFFVEIYGDGSNLQNCKDLATKLEIEEKIHFHGWVDRDTLWKEYEKADAFLLTLKPEGFIGQTVPAKLQEYLSGNRPIFASVDYASEIINEAGCGVCVPSDDHVALAEQMRKFIENHGQMPQAAENGRKYFEQHCTKDCYMSALESVLNKLVSENREGNRQ